MPYFAIIDFWLCHLVSGIITKNMLLSLPWIFFSHLTKQQKKQRIKKSDIEKIVQLLGHMKNILFSLSHTFYFLLGNQSIILFSYFYTLIQKHWFVGKFIPPNYLVVIIQEDITTHSLLFIFDVGNSEKCLVEQIDKNCIYFESMILQI